MDVVAHVQQLRDHGTALAEAAELAGLDAAVPSCPEWTVRDLLRHTGGVHRWAASFVATGRKTPYSAAEEDSFFAAPTDSGLLSWFRSGHRALVDTLSHADPGLDCLTFLRARSPLAFWARRQAHETAVHRTDAALAARAAGAACTAALDPEFAADGVDELFDGFYARRSRASAAPEEISLAVQATDADCAWTARFTAQGRTCTRGVAPADCTVTATAAQLYLLLWNRITPDGLDVAGDHAVLERWRGRQKITWS